MTIIGTIEPDIIFQIGRLFGLASLILAAISAVLLTSFFFKKDNPKNQTLAELSSSLQRWGIWLAAGVGVGMVLGSLMYSEIFEYVPCKLCWSERIATFPLALILIIAAWRKDKNIKWYAIPLAVAGICVAAYHSLIQMYPTLSGSVTCSTEEPCTTIIVQAFGFLTMPMMAIAGMLAIIGFLVWGTWRKPATSK